MIREREKWNRKIKKMYRAVREAKVVRLGTRTIYRKIPNISPGLVKVRKHFLGGLYSRGLILGGAYIRKAFCVSVRVSSPQNSLLCIAIIGKKGVSLGQNHLYFALKPI